MHKNIMEAALFISTKPMSLDQLARVSGINSLGHVKEIMESLQNEYNKRGMEIVNTPDGWSMQVKVNLLPKVAHLTPYSDLSEGPKRTLALVTLKEPVKQSKIIKMQGNKAYSYIKDLKKRGLIITEKEGHTKILKLTQEFERYFGEEKAKIKEQLEKHLQSTGQEGEPVYDDTSEPATKQLVEEKVQEFKEEKVKKEKAKISVIKDDASKEITEKTKEDQKKKDMEASHNHAFKEID